MKRIVGLILTMLVLIGGEMGSARAEEVFTVADAVTASASAGDASYAAASLTTDRSYLNVACTLDAEAAVNISVNGPDGALVYQRDYGLCSGSFCSEDIYLKLQGSDTVYQVCLTAGDRVYQFPLHRVMARLKDNAACTVGYPISIITGENTWKSATLLDLRAMEGSSVTVPIHASGAYTIGSATFSVQGGQLTVSASLDPGVDGSIDKASIQAATTAIAAATLGTKQFTGVMGTLDTPLDLSGAAYAAVLVRMTVSFNPAGVPGSPQVTLDGQENLWQQMQTETANEAVG